jgi:TPR repeat protein
MLPWRYVFRWKGCESDFAKAFDYYNRAAGMGDLDAMGEGVDIDLVKSFEWMKRAANGGL